MNTMTKVEVKNKEIDNMEILLLAIIRQHIDDYVKYGRKIQHDYNEVRPIEFKYYDDARDFFSDGDFVKYTYGKCDNMDIIRKMDKLVGIEPNNVMITNSEWRKLSKLTMGKDLIAKSIACTVYSNLELI